MSLSSGQNTMVTLDFHIFHQLRIHPPQKAIYRAFGFTPKTIALCYQSCTISIVGISADDTTRIISILSLRDACKIKIAHILSFRNNGWGGAEGGKNQIASKIWRTNDFCPFSKKVIISNCLLFQDKRVGAAFLSFEKTKYERFLYFKHP